MNVQRSPSLSVVVNVVDGHGDHNATASAITSPREFPGKISRTGPQMDPHQAHREWPGLWSEFLNTAFAGPLMVERICMQFHVNERTVRNWLKGQGGCNGRHVRVAMDYDPQAAMQTLFHMAAE
jgi:hypothetical protein